MPETTIHLDQYSADAKALVASAQSLADDKHHSTVDPIHLLARALDQADIKLLFHRIGVDASSLSNAVDLALDRLPKTSRDRSYLSAQMLDLLSRAEKEGDGQVGMDNLLNALTQESRGITSQVLRQFSIDGNTFRHHTSSLKQVGVIKTTNINSYTRDLLARAYNGEIGPIIGRDGEVRRLLQVLARSTKNNPLLVGEAGVGKSAIVEEVVKRFHNEEVPPNLAKMAFVELQLAALTSGVKSRQEIEGRVEQVLSAFKQQGKNAIVLIDGIENLFSATPMMNISDLFKTLLLRDEVRVLGMTTPDGLRKMNEKDGSLVRHFTVLNIEPATPEQAVEVLRGISSRIEKYHGVNIGDPAIYSAVSLAKRYLQDAVLPESALSVLDEAAAKKRLEITGLPEDLDKDVRRLSSLRAQSETLQHDTDPMSIKTLQRLKEEIAQLEPRVNEMCYQLDKKKTALGSVDFLRAEYQKAIMDRDLASKKQDFARLGELDHSVIPQLQEKLRMTEDTIEEGGYTNISNEIGEQEVAQIVGALTGIPVTKMLEDEAEKLLKMEERLSVRVIGQEEAVKSLSKSVRRGRVGLRDQGKPIGSFLFLGSSGVGKTLLAKALAEFLFDDEQAMTRIDMSEFSEKHTVARLVGSPPGYQDSGAGGALTNAIRKRPYSVVLFDEVEKAHADVFNLFLQVLDDGRLTDARGITTDFSNTVVIMTSNIGSKKILDADLRMFETKEGCEALKDMLRQELKNFLRPEFLNRIDDTIVFRPLTKDNLRNVIDIEMVKIEKLVAHRELKLKLTDAAKDALIEIGYDAPLGARPLKRALIKHVQDQLAEKILANGYRDGTHILIDVDDNQEFVFNA